MESIKKIDAIMILLEKIASAIESEKPEGLSARHAAAFIGIGISKFREMDANGLIPSAIRLGDGNCPRWSRAELAAWFFAGAPTRLRWQPMRNQLCGRKQ